MSGPSSVVKNDENVRKSYLGTEAGKWNSSSSRSHRSRQWRHLRLRGAGAGHDLRLEPTHINFAQGEMAMFSTYISWQLMSWGLSFWVAFHRRRGVLVRAGRHHRESDLETAATTHRSCRSSWSSSASCDLQLGGRRDLELPDQEYPSPSPRAASASPASSDRTSWASCSSP